MIDVEEIDLGRILDASANRAREGLRVVEDYARFTLNDPGLTRRLKEVRHRLAEALSGLDPEMLIGARDTRGDVGTHIMTVSERSRENPRAVLTANFKRTAEALRSLEEYAKLIDVWVAGRFEVLRYDVYTLEKLTLAAAASARVLGDARLMVLVGGEPTLGTLTWLVREALEGGADVIQFRDKARSPTRERLTAPARSESRTGAGGCSACRQRSPRLLARLACRCRSSRSGRRRVAVRDAADRRPDRPDRPLNPRPRPARPGDPRRCELPGRRPGLPEPHEGLFRPRRPGIRRPRPRRPRALPWFAIGGIDGRKPSTRCSAAMPGGSPRVALPSLGAERPANWAAVALARQARCGVG